MTSVPGNAEGTLTLPAQLPQLSNVRSAIRTSCESAAFADDSEQFRKGLAELELAVTELVSNVIRHGHREIPDGSLQFQLKTTDTQFELKLVHNGQPFDGNAAEINEITDPQEGGMGLYLISQCVDQVTYGKTPAGAAQIRLTRTFQTSEGTNE